MSGIFPFMHPQPGPAQPIQYDQTPMVHGLYPEDFLDKIVCLKCAEWARTREGYDFGRYAKNVLQFHNVDLYPIYSQEGGAQEFLVFFSNSPAPTENSPQTLIEKLGRLNALRKIGEIVRGDNHE